MKPIWERRIRHIDRRVKPTAISKLGLRGQLLKAKVKERRGLPSRNLPVELVFERVRLELELDVDNSGIELLASSRPTSGGQFNPGAVHGVLAAMLDEALSPALASLPGPGEIFGKARIVSRGKAICFLEAFLRDGSRRQVAAATATAMMQRLK